jgi:hypothetical protein
MFWIPTNTDCLCSSTVALYFVSLHELTLMNRYHQTQGRPKPPVEQRVKVMDTLDKKMQSILKRVDLSTDERLKLYDQSFTRYLNVHDDYRLRPVVSRVSTSPPADGEKGRNTGGNIGKRSENYENQGRAIGTENESRS